MLQARLNPKRTVTSDCSLQSVLSFVISCPSCVNPMSWAQQEEVSPTSTWLAQVHTEPCLWAPGVPVLQLWLFPDDTSDRSPDSAQSGGRPETGARGAPRTWEAERAGQGPAAAVIDGADAQRARAETDTGVGRRSGDARRKKGEDRRGEGKREKKRRKTV